MNDAKIKTNCTISLKPQSHNLAYNLKDNYQAFSSIITEEIQVQCITKTNYIEIKSPFQVINISNRCEDYSLTMMIPQHSFEKTLLQLIQLMIMRPHSHLLNNLTQLMMMIPHNCLLKMIYQLMLKLHH